MNGTEKKQRVSRRRAVQLEVKIIFRPPASFASSVGVERLALVGRTKNISETGLALVVSARNIDRYLNATDNTFDVELRLPDGAVVLQATPVHFKKSAAGSSTTYLIGSRFTNANSPQQAHLIKFLRALSSPT